MKQFTTILTMIGMKILKPFWPEILVIVGIISGAGIYVASGDPKGFWDYVLFNWEVFMISTAVIFLHLEKYIKFFKSKDKSPKRQAKHNYRVWLEEKRLREEYDVKQVEQVEQVVEENHSVKQQEKIDYAMKQLETDKEEDTKNE